MAEYRAVSGTAVAALVVGLLAPLAMIDPLLWAVPIAGLLLGLVALWRVYRLRPALIGRKAALIGLFLSLLWGVAGPSDFAAFRCMLRREARQFARAWFGFLADNEPQKAHQLTVYPTYRQAFDERLDSFYREGSKWRSELDGYALHPPVRTLLDLGPRAEVRYLRTTNQCREQGSDLVDQLYAVRSEENGRPQEFEVSMQLQRVYLDDGRANWRILRAELVSLSE